MNHHSSYFADPFLIQEDPLRAINAPLLDELCSQFDSDTSRWGEIAVSALIDEIDQLRSSMASLVDRIRFLETRKGTEDSNNFDNLAGQRTIDDFLSGLGGSS